MKDLQKNMLAIFKRSGFNLTREETEKFLIFYELLAANNKKYDLTRLTSFDDIVIKHFIDSIYITRLIHLPSPLLDIGTGAGFPGIPLAIMNPELRIILSEPRKRRVSFLQMAITELNLDFVDIYPHMVTDKSFLNVQGIITRALESIDKTLTRVSHFLPRQGRVILMKGPEAERDLYGLTDGNKRGYSLECDIPYTLPATSHDRRIIVFKKESPSRKRTYRIMKNKKESAGITISSRENKNFKRYQKIITIEGIRKTGEILISGKKIIRDLLERGSVSPRECIIYDGYVEEDDRINSMMEGFTGNRSLVILKKSLYNEIDSFHTGGPLLVCEAPEIPAWDQTAIGCTVLIPFQDPVNVGSSIRSAAGFNASRIVLLSEAAHPFHPKSVRTSAGAVFSANLLHGPSITEIPEIVKANQLDIVTLDMTGRPLEGFTFPQKFLLIPGIEGPGLPDTLKGKALSIHLNQNVDSLNAPVALSVALYEWQRKR